MPVTRVSFFISDHLAVGLKRIKHRDGVPEAESIRRAIAEYLKRKKVTTKAKRPTR
jgi:ribosomal protein S15P/S13E